MLYALVCGILKVVKLLNLMYALAKEYNEDDDYEHKFTSDELNIFEERKKKRISGESKTYSWGEAKEYITGKEIGMNYHLQI